MGAEELKAAQEKKSQVGMMFMLALAFTAAMFGYGYAWYHVDIGARNAEQFGLELSELPIFYMRFSRWIVLLPVLILAGALAVTGLGKTRRNLGVMLAVLLFAFSILWPAGAVVAFMDAYDPPRTFRAPDSDQDPA